MSKDRPFYLLLLFFVLSLTSLSFAAQNNRFVAKNFKWRVAQSGHFDIYHTLEAEKLLPLVCQTVEESYHAVTRLLDIPVKERAPFFFFLNHNDFEQNAVVDVGEGTGGVTEAFKDRFLVFNNGSQNWLEHVIRHEFTHEVQFKVLYGGFFRSAKLIKSVLYPLWFMEGMAEYGSGPIDDPTKEMFLRDAVTSKKWIPLTQLHNFNHLKPNQVTLAYKIGDAAVSYIAQEYGKEKVGELLHTISERFDMNGALQEILGLDLQELNAKLLESLEDSYEEESKSLKEPADYGEKLTPADDIYPVFDSNPAYFPDGLRFAYLSDKTGVTELKIDDLANKRDIALEIQKRFSNRLENIHREGSALSVSANGRWILFAGEHHQRDYLYLYDLKRERLRRISIPLDAISSPQFSPDGKGLAFIGMKDGITDLYTCDLNGKKLKQQTQTFADEGDVRFFPGGKRVLFSREGAKAGPRYERDLWILDLESGMETQITQNMHQCSQGAISPTGEEIIFVSDQDGIFNLYSLNLNSGKLLQLTHVIGGNFNPTYSPDGKSLLFVSHRGGEQRIYLSFGLGEGGKLFPGGRSALQPRFLFPRPKESGSETETPRKEFSTPSHPELVTNIVVSSCTLSEPYRFKASTDFFFPIFFYSSTDGLFVSSYWRASEMLGHHRLQAAVSYASKIDFLNYSLLYEYVRFRPQIFIGAQGDTTENVLLTTREVRREDAQFVGVSYPLSRFDKVEAKVLASQRRVQLTDDPLVTLRLEGKEYTSSLAYSRDVTRGRYLETTWGYRTTVSFDESNHAWGSELDYRNLFLDYQQFVPLHRESSFALRLFSGASFGENPQTFRTGGADLLRGYSRFDSVASGRRFALSNAEIRFPLFFDLNFHIWFLFPDFLFKNVYGSVFMDSGVIGNDAKQISSFEVREYQHSLGVGLRFQAFVLQTFPVILQLDWARRTKDGEQTFSFGFGPNF